MIDTVVLTLPERMYTIFNHERFDPSTAGLFDPKQYYRMGGRSNIVCKQNPTVTELKSGIYKPRLSVTKRMNKFHSFEVMLKIEFSIPKLLFNNNFDELTDCDFPEVVRTLRTKLWDMGVVVMNHFIESAPVSSIHYAKNFPLTDYTTPFTYLSEIRNCNMTQRLDLDLTNFRNDGDSLKFHANSYEVAFYDKLKDIQQSKISEKRAYGKDNLIQLHLFDEKPVRKPFEVLRMEVRINKKQKLKQILEKVGIADEPVFSSLFHSSTAQKVLTYYLNEIESCYPQILTYPNQSARNLWFELIRNNPNNSVKKNLATIGSFYMIQDLGMRQFKDAIKNNYKSQWPSLIADISAIKIPEHPSIFQPLRQTIADYKPMRLIDYQAQMINNVK